MVLFSLLGLALLWCSSLHLFLLILLMDASNGVNFTNNSYSKTSVKKSRTTCTCNATTGAHSSESLSTKFTRTSGPTFKDLQHHVLHLDRKVLGNRLVAQVPDTARLSTPRLVYPELGKWVVSIIMEETFRMCDHAENNATITPKESPVPLSRFGVQNGCGPFNGGQVTKKG